MSAGSQKSLIRRSPAEKPRDYPNVLYQELDTFCPSPALQQMNEVLSAVPVDLSKLGRAVKDDACLAAEAIRFCNSSLFALSRPVSSVEQAVVNTNADLVRTLLLTCWLTKLTGSKISVRENQMFWGHSLLVAQISRQIGDWVGLAQPEQVFLAGLLHDAGALPFLTFLSRDEAAKQRDIFVDLGDSVELQKVRFGTDHCELGQRLNAILDFPLAVAEVIAGHHQRKAGFSLSPLLSIIGCAELISQVSYRFARQELRTEEVGSFVKDALLAWLPGLNPSASLSLVVALKSDLMGNFRLPRPGVQDAWVDSISGSGLEASA